MTAPRAGAPSRLFPRALAFGLAIFLADRLSKIWLIDFLQNAHPQGYLELTPFFRLVMVWNKGISFGMFQSQGQGRWILFSIGVAVTLALLVWLWRVERRWLAVAIGAVIGGSVGNLYDRWSYGAVADFFDFYLFGYHWPAFNLADSAITIGVALIILDAILEQRAEKHGEDDIVP